MSEEDSARDLIDRFRDGAAQMQVGDESEGPIREMIGCDGLYAIKDEAIYLIRLADEIDPERRNAKVPNVQQKFLDVGYRSPLVGRVLLTARTMFAATYFDERIEREALVIAFRLLTELTTMDRSLVRLIADEDEAEKKVRQGPHRSLSLPSVPDLAARTKAFVQASDHAAQDLYRLCLLFYEPRKGWFRTLARTVRERHPERMEFGEFLDGAARFLSFIRNVRHCIEHPQAAQRIAVQDFHLTPDCELHGPSIEIIHPETAEPELPLRCYMDQVLQALVDTTERMVVELAAANATFSGFDIDVCELEASRRRHPDARYAYAVRIGDAWQPVG